MLRRLRRAAGQFPRARWEPSNEHLVIMSARLLSGRLCGRQAGRPATVGFGKDIAVIISHGCQDGGGGERAAPPVVKLNLDKTSIRMRAVL